MFTALQNIVPSHLADGTHYDFKGLTVTGVADDDGDKAFDPRSFRRAASRRACRSSGSEARAWHGRCRMKTRVAFDCWVRSCAALLLVRLRQRLHAGQPASSLSPAGRVAGAAHLPFRAAAFATGTPRQAAAGGYGDAAVAQGRAAPRRRQSALHACRFPHECARPVAMGHPWNGWGWGGAAGAGHHRGMGWASAARLADGAALVPPRSVGDHARTLVKPGGFRKRAINDGPWADDARFFRPCSRPHLQGFPHPAARAAAGRYPGRR